MPMIIGHAMGFVLSKLSHGYYTFSMADAEDVLGPGVNTRQAIYRLARKGWLFSPSKGFYVIIDPQHQASGYIPVEWFVDDWMKHMGAQYYLGILTAAMLHGASHQKPQQVQIVSDKELNPVEKGAYQISFYFKQSIPENCCEQRKSPAGYYRVSTPEMTAYDILRYPRACPSLDLAGTIMHELGEEISPDRLANIVDSDMEVAVLQRLGWLLDRVGWAEKTDLFADKLRRGKTMVWRKLRTDVAEDGPRDPRWRIIVNTDVEIDL